MAALVAGANRWRRIGINFKTGDKKNKPIRRGTPISVEACMALGGITVIPDGYDMNDQWPSQITVI